MSHPIHKHSSDAPALAPTGASGGCEARVNWQLGSKVSVAAAASEEHEGGKDAFLCQSRTVPGNERLVLCSGTETVLCLRTRAGVREGG